MVDVVNPHVLALRNRLAVHAVRFGRRVLGALLDRLGVPVLEGLHGHGSPWVSVHAAILHIDAATGLHALVALAHVLAAHLRDAILALHRASLSICRARHNGDPTAFQRADILAAGPLTLALELLVRPRINARLLRLRHLPSLDGLRRPRLRIGGMGFVLHRIGAIWASEGRLGELVARLSRQLGHRAIPIGAMGIADPSGATATLG